jgi:hypothetical protein
MGKQFLKLYMQDLFTFGSKWEDFCVKSRVVTKYFVGGLQLCEDLFRIQRIAHEFRKTFMKAENLFYEQKNTLNNQTIEH